MTSARSISEADRDRLESAILDAGKVDYLDVWFISRLAQQEFRALDRGELRNLVLAALEHLLRSEQLRAGDLVSPGEFVPWTLAPEESYDRVRTQITALHRDLKVGDVAWFEVPE